MKKNEKLYAIALETIGDPDFTCKDDNENPWLFMDPEDAWREIADSKIIELQSFIRGERTHEETDFDTDEFVVEVKIQNGKLVAVGTYVEPHELNGELKDLTIQKSTTAARHIILQIESELRNLDKDVNYYGSEESETKELEIIKALQALGYNPEEDDEHMKYCLKATMDEGYKHLIERIKSNLF